MTLAEAKKRLVGEYRHVEGFVGAGIGRQGDQDILMVFVREAASPAARRLERQGQYEGHPIKIQVADVRPQS